jgi:hypothetical protein
LSEGLNSQHEVQHAHTVDEVPEFSPHLDFQQDQGSLDIRLLDDGLI